MTRHLTPASDIQSCVQRLREYGNQNQVSVDLSSVPVAKTAAVLVILYERSSRLHVLLTTRSKSLRSHPGQTALPGGKTDEGDGGPVRTAFREANEEVGFPFPSTLAPISTSSPHTTTRPPLDSNSLSSASPDQIEVLCTIPPVISAYRLLVTPVVAFLSDLSLLDGLVPNPGEVDAIFEHPLEALLDPGLLKLKVDLGNGDADVDRSKERPNEEEFGTEEGIPLDRGGEWPYDPDELYHFSDSAWIRDSLYRNNRFRSSHSAVKGMTSDVLITVAEIAFGRPPSFDRFAPSQMSFAEGVEVVIEGHRRDAAEADATNRRVQNTPLHFTSQGGVHLLQPEIYQPKPRSYLNVHRRDLGMSISAAGSPAPPA